MVVKIIETGLSLSPLMFQEGMNVFKNFDVLDFL